MALVQVTLTIQSDDVPPVALVGARVTVMDTGQTTVYADLTSGVGGECAAIALEESTDYAVLLSHPYTTFTVPETLSLPAGTTPVEETFEGDYTSPDVPTPDTCRVYGYLKELDGTPWIGASVIADNLFNVIDVAGAAILAPRIDDQTDSDGLFELDLVRETTVRISIQNTDFAAHLQVPDQANANITDLLSTATEEIPEVVRG